MITDAELIKQYDARYASDKGKWAIPERDQLAFDTVMEYVPEPLEILDVGCGQGHTMEYFQKHGCEAAMYGIDLSQVAIDLAKKNVKNGQFEAEFLTEYRTRKKFEVIICLGTAEHFRELDENLKRMKSLLKKDGVVYMEIPNNLKYSPGKHEFRQLQSGSRQYEHHLSQSEWEQKFKDAGFVIVNFYNRNRPAWQFCWVLK